MLVPEKDVKYITSDFEMGKSLCPFSARKNYFVSVTDIITEEIVYFLSQASILF